MKKSLLATLSSLLSLTDEQAMARVGAQDDAHAFAQLMRRWEAPIQRLCTRMLGDPHRGEDVAQETFARLFARRKDYQPTGRFSTFLWRIALNLCYDELRRIKRRSESPFEQDEVYEDHETPSFQVLAPSPAALLLERERGELVRHAVLQLSECYRSVIVLRHYEHLKFREIAEVLGIPEGTVKSRMAEALTQLHRILSPTLAEGSPELCQKPIRQPEQNLVL